MSFNAMQIAHDTVTYIKEGGYNGNKFNPDISKAILYTPDDLKRLSVKILLNTNLTNVTLYNQDTCECAKRFIDSGYTCILNFASARHIGGGFLNGAMAQEEAICRNSTLFASISSDSAKEYYEYNNSHNEELYSDYTIFSPCVEVIRNGKGELLKKPFTISAITSPAVNVNRVRSASRTDIAKCMLQRAEYILKIAVDNHVDNIVLGAWGCGVFGNNPEDISEMFRYLLIDKGYIKAFKNVSFAVYGKNPRNYDAFKDTIKKYL